MINVSSAIAGEFTSSAAQITEVIKQLGPNPLSANGRTIGEDINDRKEPDHANSLDDEHEMGEH